MKIIAFDLDDVLCVRDKKYEHLGVEKYLHCQPIQKYIEIMNQCYDAGYYVKIYTARGMTQFNGNVKDIELALRPITESQLKSWDAHYHELIFGKTHYELLIDDKAWNIQEINSFESLIEKIDAI